MPTPFYHLSLAEDLLNHPALPGEVRQFLLKARCAFLFGNTAPDVQVVSGEPRQATHFFDLPIRENAPLPWVTMLATYPALAHAGGQPVEQAAFVCGYLCHLQADWIWVKDIFAPIFGLLIPWGRFRERLYLHNVLRAYLDVRILPRLTTGMSECLQEVEPQGWLPFVADHHLRRWRDLLYPQLRPGAELQTVEVFSARGGYPADEFKALVGSEERMQQEVFSHLSLKQVQSYHRHVLEENVCLLSGYLASSLHPTPRKTKGDAYEGVRL